MHFTPAFALPALAAGMAMPNPFLEERQSVCLYNNFRSADSADIVSLVPERPCHWRPRDYCTSWLRVLLDSRQLCLECLSRFHCGSAQLPGMRWAKQLRRRQLCELSCSRYLNCGLVDQLVQPEVPEHADRPGWVLSGKSCPARVRLRSSLTNAGWSSLRQRGLRWRRSSRRNQLHCSAAHRCRTSCGQGCHLDG
jgi:hypothetical protein